MWLHTKVNLECFNTETSLVSDTVCSRIKKYCLHQIPRYITFLLKINRKKNHKRSNSPPCQIHTLTHWSKYASNTVTYSFLSAAKQHFARSAPMFCKAMRVYRRDIQTKTALKSLHGRDSLSNIDEDNTVFTHSSWRFSAFPANEPRSSILSLSVPAVICPDVST